MKSWHRLALTVLLVGAVVFVGLGLYGEAAGRRTGLQAAAPVGAISGPATLLIGEMGTYQESRQSATTYTWTVKPDATLTPNAASVVFKATASGDYTLNCAGQEWQRYGFFKWRKRLVDWSESAGVKVTEPPIPQPPAITSPTEAKAYLKRAFTYQIAASNAPTSYGATGLPPWLTINAASGLLSGTPPALGEFKVTVSATNSVGTGQATLLVTVLDLPPPPTDLYAVVVEEQSARTAKQGVVLGSSRVRKAFKSFRVADQDVKDENNQPPKDLKPYLDKAKGKPLPYLMVANVDASVFYWEGSLPETVDAVLNLVKEIKP